MAPVMALVNVPSLFEPSPLAISVIDPQLKQFGRLWLPIAKLLPTNGLARHRSGHPYPPSLCLLFQKQRCHAGEQCNQIHADVEFIAAARVALQGITYSNCCHQHGDLPSTRRDFQGLCQTMRVSFVAGDGVTKFPISSGEVAVTAFWNKWIEENTTAMGSSAHRTTTEVTITPADICYLHQRSSCKYGVDCKHVHVCRATFAEITVELGRRVSGTKLTSFPTPTPMSSIPTPILTPVPMLPIAMASANAMKRLPFLTVESQPVLREQLTGKCLAAAPAASRGSAFPTAGIPAVPAVHPSAAERSGFVPLKSWRKGTPQAPQGASRGSKRKGKGTKEDEKDRVPAADAVPNKPLPLPLEPAQVVPGLGEGLEAGAGAEGLSLSAPRVSKKPLPLPLPLEVVPGLGEGPQAEEVLSPTTGDSIARHLIAMSDDWGEPSKCEEEVEKALQHERTAWVGHRAGSSRLPSLGFVLTSPTRA
eukprot:RCo007342